MRLLVFVGSKAWTGSRMWLRHFSIIFLLTSFPLSLHTPPLAPLPLVFVSFPIHDDVPLFLSVFYFTENPTALT